MKNAMTATEHFAALSLPDPARDSVADRHGAAVVEIDDYLSTLPAWKQLLSYQLHEVAAKAELIDADARAAFASDPSNELPYGAVISTDYESATVPAEFAPDPPGAVPVVLFLSQRRGAPTIERHYAFGPRTLPAIVAEASEVARTERACDLRMFSPTGLHDSVTKRSSRFVWPIARGERLVLVRYCSECLGALFARYEVGKCEISEPWGIG